MSSLGVYTRLSKDPEGTKTATERQEKACRKWAKDNGHRIVDRYRDNDLSAFKKDTVRPEFLRLLSDLEGGRIEGVVVWRSDRFTRQPVELERYLELADKTGVRLWSVTEPFDNSAMGNWMLRQFVNQHNFESAVKSERIRDAVQHLVLEGKPFGGHRPFGYEKDQLHVRAKEATLIREAVERVLAGEAVYAITEDWAARGVRTPRGNPFDAGGLQRVLLRPRTRGEREHKGRVVGPAVWPAIITAEEAEQMRLLIGARATRFGPVRRRYLLTGLVHCALCKRKLLGQRLSNGTGSYVCVRSNVTGACGKVRIIAPPLEEWVVDEVLEAVDSAAFRKRLSKGRRTTDDTAKLRASIDIDEAKLADLARQWDDGELDDISWRTARRRVDERLAVTRQQLETARARELPTPAADTAERWETATPDQKRAFIAVYVERIMVGPARAKGVKTPPEERAKISWRG